MDGAQPRGKFHWEYLANSPCQKFPKYLKFAPILISRVGGISSMFFRMFFQILILRLFRCFGRRFLDQRIERTWNISCQKFAPIFSSSRIRDGRKEGNIGSCWYILRIFMNIGRTRGSTRARSKFLFRRFLLTIGPREYNGYYSVD